MSVPTHRAGCETRMWSTRCPSCQASVFFFSCSCGSRVFFDSPGPPWPLHQDRCIPYLVTTLRANGSGAREILRMLEAAAARTGKEIPVELARQLEADDFKQTGQGMVVMVEPDAEGMTLDGVVMSADEVNFFKRLDYPDTQMSRGLLGKVVREDRKSVV